MNALSILTLTLALTSFARDASPAPAGKTPSAAPREQAPAAGPNYNAYSPGVGRVFPVRNVNGTTYYLSSRWNYMDRGGRPETTPLRAWDLVGGRVASRTGTTITLEQTRLVPDEGQWKKAVDKRSRASRSGLYAAAGERSLPAPGQEWVGTYRSEVIWTIVVVNVPRKCPVPAVGETWYCYALGDGGRYDFGTPTEATGSRD